MTRASPASSSRPSTIRRRYLHLSGTADYTRGQNRSTDQPLPLVPPFRATYSARFEGKGNASS